ncbi:hypothetical protein LOD99_10491 [Oopsacas minuta]|uniref:Uncharacterized protein n=1 Tax=Oopsacas minuta TaxID=111878 RepID=A0AAV7KGG4_9METZ|nr:hypothetical protein LOD99_10491 [Oopsacas minuta]
MDEFGLPVVGAGLDYTKVEALPPKQLLALVNSFVVHTVHFLNSFAHDADNKLSNTSKKIQQLEISLNLIEAKLSHIPGIENAEGKIYTPPDSLANAGLSVKPRTSRVKENKEEQREQPKQTEMKISSPDHQSVQIIETNSPLNQTTPDLPPSPLPDIPGVPQLTIKDDPQYKEWFRKLKYGASKDQLSVAMRGHGLNPDLLDNPDMPIGGKQGTISPPHPLVDEQNLVEDLSSSSLSDDSPDFSD